MLGNKGLTDNVVAETVQALRDHELIKVRVRAGDRDQRDALFAGLVARTGCTLVTRIGHVAVLYRPPRRSRAWCCPTLRCSAPR